MILGCEEMFGCLAKRLFNALCLETRLVRVTIHEIPVSVSSTYPVTLMTRTMTHHSATGLDSAEACTRASPRACTMSGFARLQAPPDLQPPRFAPR